MSQQRKSGRRRGAIAVIRRQRTLLVIRRSVQVEAPGTYCFPGGAIENGETPREAVIRELDEELGVHIEPVRQLWENVTPWDVELCWWLAELDRNTQPRPNPAEVADVLWLTPEQMVQLPTLLISNWRFLDAWQRGQFQLGGEQPPENSP